MAWHHPDKRNSPRWVLDVGNQMFHKVVTVVQRMLPTIENLVVIRNLVDALEWEYLRKKEVLDVAEGIGVDSTAVKKAIKEAEDA